MGGGWEHGSKKSLGEETHGWETACTQQLLALQSPLPHPSLRPWWGGGVTLVLRPNFAPPPGISLPHGDPPVWVGLCGTCTCLAGLESSFRR